MTSFPASMNQRYHGKIVPVIMCVFGCVVSCAGNAPVVRAQILASEPLSYVRPENATVGASAAVTEPSIDRSNLRVFFPTNQLREWIGDPQNTKFNETFEFRGKSQPASGTARTTVQLDVPSLSKRNSLSIHVDSQVKTRLTPSSPLGRLYIDANSHTQRIVTFSMQHNLVALTSSCPTASSCITGNGICLSPNHHAGKRIKERIVQAVVNAKNNDIIARLNTKIANNFQQQTDDRTIPVVTRINETLQAFAADLKNRQLNCRFCFKQDATGVIVAARIDAVQGSQNETGFLPIKNRPEGCWVAFHETAINNLQPLLDNRTLDAKEFNNWWGERFLNAKQVQPWTATLERNEIRARLTEEVSIRFSKPAVETAFVKDQMLMTLRIAAIMNQAAVMNLEPPLLCKAIYDLEEKDGQMRLTLNEKSLDTIEEKSQAALRQFLPKVMQYTGGQLDTILETKLGIRLSKPTADDGWLVLPFETSN